MTQPLHIRTRRWTSQPVWLRRSSLRRGGRKLAIHRDRSLQRDERTLMLNRKREGVIQPPRPHRKLRIRWSNQHLDSGRSSSAPIPSREPVGSDQGSPRHSARFRPLSRRPSTARCARDEHTAPASRTPSRREHHAPRRPPASARRSPRGQSCHRNAHPHPTWSLTA